MPGPPKTPTKILDKRGSWRAKLRHNEPQASGVPKCPVWLSKEAKKHWRLTVKRLMDMKLVGECDTDKLAVYCSCYAEFILAAKNNNVQAMIKLAPIIDRLGTQFGMSPSARASMAIEMPQKEAKQNKFLLHNKKA